MTQLSPDTSVYAKALNRLKEIDKDSSNGRIKSTEEYMAAIQDVTKSLFSREESLNRFTNFIDNGAPVLSDQVNSFWDEVSGNTSILSTQIDYLKAHVLASYNALTSEVLKSSNENLRIHNKLKTLQLYIGTSSSNTLTFGDYMRNYDAIDISAVTSSHLCDISYPGKLTLGLLNDMQDYAANAAVYVLNDSNGFAGKNQEVYLDGINSNIKFYSEDNPHNDIDAIMDSNPTTWFEYEANEVSKQDQKKAENLNWEYKDTNADGTSILVAWADGPSGKVLKLSLLIDLLGAKQVNRIAYTPYNIYSSVEHPVTIKSIEASEDGSVWRSISSAPMLVSENVNVQIDNEVGDLAIGSASWLVNDGLVRYVRISVEQKVFVDSNIGHLYYESSDPINGVAKRVEGPIPKVSSPAGVLAMTNVSSTVTQKREMFVGKRWAIGIKDVAIDGVLYNESSSIVSKTFRIDGEVDRIALEADFSIPDSFDSYNEWVKFYVSPNNGKNWFRISNIRDDILDIPEIIAFNDPTPIAFRETGVTYESLDGKLDSVKVRIDMARPGNSPSMSPVVNWYKIKVIKK